MTMLFLPGIIIRWPSIAPNFPAAILETKTTAWRSYEHHFTNLAIFTDGFLPSQCYISHMASSKDNFTCRLKWKSLNKYNINEEMHFCSAQLKPHWSTGQFSCFRHINLTAVGHSNDNFMSCQSQSCARSCLWTNFSCLHIAEEMNGLCN